VRLVSHHNIHLCYPYSIRIHSGGSNERRFDTLDDDSNDGDDEPQNYFAGELSRPLKTDCLRLHRHTRLCTQCTVARLTRK
jgi:hypothetical protein